MEINVLFGNTIRDHQSNDFIKKKNSTKAAIVSAGQQLLYDISSGNNVSCFA